MADDNNLIFFDIETGGLDRFKHPIIELAAIAVQAGTYEEIEAFEAKVQFKASQADEVALGICKFSPSRWEQYALPKRVVAKKFATFLRRYASIEKTSKCGKNYRIAQLVAHNASFDGPFIQEWYRKQKRYLPASPQVLCSMQMALWFFHQNPSLVPPKNFKLGTLCDYFRVEATPDHSALNDIRATVELARTIRRLELDALTAIAA